MARRIAECRIGTSGYQYAHWKSIFYPDGLPQKRWFPHYAAQFDTVEINNTFYRLPAPQVFESWRTAAPPGFCYAVKFNRFGTHFKKLMDAPATIERFLDAAERLGGTLGPILVHLPPHWQADRDRLDQFLAAAPRRHRWAVEFRDPSWLRDDIFETLAKHAAALCIHDIIPAHPRLLTTDWTYLRYHGATRSERYAGTYSPQRLAADADRITEWLSAGRDVYAYFNNDLGGHAIRDALRLREYVGQRR